MPVFIDSETSVSYRIVINVDTVLEYSVFDIWFIELVSSSLL